MHTTYLGPDSLELIIFDIINKKIYNLTCCQSVIQSHYQFFVCNHKEFPCVYYSVVILITGLNNQGLRYDLIHTHLPEVV